MAGALGGAAFLAPAFGGALTLAGCEASSSARRRSRSALRAAGDESEVSCEETGRCCRASERGVRERERGTHRVRPLQLQPWTPLRPCPLRPAPTSLPPAAPSPGRPLPSCPAPAPPCGPVAVRWVSSSRGMRLQSRDAPLRRWPLRSALAEERGERRRRGGGERSARTGATGAGQRVDALPWVVSSVCRYERLLLVTRRSRKKGGDRRASCADADADLAPPPFPLPHPLAPWTEQQAQQHTHTSHVDPSHLGPQHPGPSSLHPLISSPPSPPPL